MPCVVSQAPRAASHQPTPEYAKEKHGPNKPSCNFKFSSPRALINTSIDATTLQHPRPPLADVFVLQGAPSGSSSMHQNDRHAHTSCTILCAHNRNSSSSTNYSKYSYRQLELIAARSHDPSPRRISHAGRCRWLPCPITQRCEIGAN